MVFNQLTPGVAQVLQLQQYYAYGMQMGDNTMNYVGTNKDLYGYNGKEEQPDQGLDWIDYGARFYDAELGRWHVVDMLADEPEQTDQSPYQYGWNNPVNLVDPDGNCPSCAAAAIAALLDVGLQLAEIALDDKKTLSDFSRTSVVTSAVAGAVGVGIATKIDKAIKIANLGKTSATAVKVTSNVATDATTSAASQQLKDGTVSLEATVVDVFAAQTAGKIAGNFAENAAKNSNTGKVLANQADRAQRVADNNPRPSRTATAQQAQQKAESYVASRVAAAATAGSNAVSSFVKPNAANTNTFNEHNRRQLLGQ